MQDAHEAGGRRPGQQFAGVDLRRPKGYAAPPAPAAARQVAPAPAGEGDSCPRCQSRDTKFCYYNNYNTAQPRHFCKGCRRYWTKGGTLRNVPVGGGTRKKPSPPSASSSPSAPAAKPKKPSKKKRRVAPTEPSTDTPVLAAAEPAKTTAEATTTTPGTTTTTPTDTASEITTDLTAPAAEEDSVAHLLQPDDAAAAVALELGLSELPSGKCLGLAEPDSFDWPPPAFDLGSYWGSAAFADPDPAVFLNFP